MEFKARSIAHAWVSGVVRAGDCVVDATMGNGNDTLFLAGLVGKNGLVYAFDVQQGALTATHKKLSEAEISHVKLILLGHEQMNKAVREPVRCVMFNLGWQPGGDKSITTLADTTLAALGCAQELLVPGGLITVCAYPGHPEGRRELDQVLAWAKAQDSRHWAVAHTGFPNLPNDPPEVIAIGKI